MATPASPSRCVQRSESGTMPIPAWIGFPRAMSCGTSRLTVSTGTAKPMPALAPLGE